LSQFARIPRDHSGLASQSHCTGKKAFELPMENNVVLTGTDGPGEPHRPRRKKKSVDYKNRKNRRMRTKRKKDLQLSVYAARGPGKCSTGIPARLTFYNLQTNQGREAAARERQKNSTRCARRKFRKAAGRHPGGKVSSQARLSGASIAITNLSARPREQGARRPAPPVKSNSRGPRHTASIQAPPPGKSNFRAGQSEYENKKRGRPGVAGKPVGNVRAPVAAWPSLRFPCVPIRAIRSVKRLSPSEQRVTPLLTR